jgi:DNA modification methylase
MVFTDPPGNVKIRSIQRRRGVRHREFIQASGELSSERFTVVLIESLSLAAKHSADGSIHFVFMDWPHVEELLIAGKEVYRGLQNIAVWVKTNPGPGALYRSQHELVFVFRNGEEPHLNNVALGRHGRNRSNVWSYAGADKFPVGRLDDLSAHPTVKPVALVADAMRDCSRRGDIVLDPFLGAGTTILAAERVRRRGYGIEIDPQYVDTAIRRWQHYTKREAILQASGGTFDELAASPSRRAK